MSIMTDLADTVRSHDLLCIVRAAGPGSRLVKLIDRIAQLTSHPVPCLPANISSAFTTTTIKPALGTSYAQFPDTTLLIQRTRDVFVVDEGETSSERRVVEVLKRKDGASCLLGIQ